MCIVTGGMVTCVLSVQNPAAKTGVMTCRAMNQNIVSITLAFRHYSHTRMRRKIKKIKCI
jgi:hypothetical protein